MDAEAVPHDSEKVYTEFRDRTPGGSARYTVAIESSATPDDTGVRAILERDSVELLAVHRALQGDCAVTDPPRMSFLLTSIDFTELAAVVIETTGAEAATGCVDTRCRFVGCWEGIPEVEIEGGFKGLAESAI